MIEPVLQNECIVSGTLGFVLRISQIYGVASLKFKRVHDGWRIQVSRAANIYGKCAIFSLGLLTALTLTWDINLDNESAFHFRTGVGGVLNVTSTGVVAIVLFIEAYYGIPRMKHVITCLAQMQKINAELSIYGPRISFERTERLMAVWSIIGGHLILIVDSGMYLYQIIDKQNGYYWEAIYITFYVHGIMLKVLILQISLLFMSVLSSFNHLNACLKYVLLQINISSKLWTSESNDEVTPNNYISYKSLGNVIDVMTVSKDAMNKSTDTAAVAVNRLNIQYCSLCEIVQQIDYSHGMLLVPMITCFLLHLISSPYYFITKLFGSDSDIYKSLMQFAWLLYHGLDLTMIVESCHRTHVQMNRTKHLVSQLLRNTPRKNHDIISELKLFYKHLMSVDVVYAPKKLFQINRTLFITILGSITTYLVILVQL